jgi:hypothetical protein
MNFGGLRIFHIYENALQTFMMTVLKLKFVTIHNFNVDLYMKMKTLNAIYEQPGRS